MFAPFIDVKSQKTNFIHKVINYSLLLSVYKIMLSIWLYLKKSILLYKKLLNIFRLEIYWKERIIGVLGLGMYFFGNLIEILSSPEHTTTDPPVFWITGTFLSVALIWI